MAAGRPTLTVLVLAAGKGTRLRSRTIKLLHPVAGQPMVSHVLDAASGLRPGRTVTVVGYQADQVKHALSGHDTRFAMQREQLGTGHAVLQAKKELRQTGTLLVVNGDLPTLRTASLRRFLDKHRRSRAALSVLSAEIPDAAGYGRIVRNENDVFQRIVEHKDASRAERKIREINVGIYAANPAKLLRTLARVRPHNKQGEYYITDAVHALLSAGERVIAVRHDDAAEVLGVNTRAELAESGQTLYKRKAQELQSRGITFLDASTTFVDPRANVGPDTVLYPNVMVEGACRIGRDVVIRPGCRIVDSTIGDSVEIRDHCVVQQCRIDRGAQVGPFAHLRPDSHLGADSRVGNFVELKKTHLGKGSKASHLAYLGDAEIGPGCNIGAGTIFCNYDGVRKHRTELGRGVFIGSDSQLVAPLSIGHGAYVGAGSTITEDVPIDALAVSRGKQRNIPNWAKKRRAKAAARKKKTSRRG
ncbi:MAG: bifunctional UDP-N-acetylglucosamine diphosphorylase/glucosamine-1-phosphate N-acetyltransferase GlmU [Acidobacteriota bacterium]|nr:bifunctional UDP-N-acetylglucosamine diphosphorylase/glucosamine-1-phosphate N-acetyltransferase GlmU [Acidobacteriota bacterium]MDH3784269.1 bifunctional UDP-N-acetylglucosamine diphosphorylase/glucosamine-1-phosphate N-acetyltransferase GlmU [Acidobacteriota bacterium]